MVTENGKKSDAKALKMEQLLQRAVSGEGAAYQQFLTAISHYLRPFIARRIPSADIEDVLQEILVSIHKARHTYDGKRPILPWIFAIARYRVVDYLRSHYSKLQYAPDDISQMQDFLCEDVTKPSELSEYITEEVGKLPSKQQKIIHLIHTEGYTAKEVGVQLGMNESAVKVSAHRAYKLIKARLPI
jgi:RNA polymerase sigma-70 factor (ECF subfamily)